MMSNPHQPVVPADVLSRRRAAVLEALGADVMVLPAAPRLLRSRDTEHGYRPDNELFYTTGLTEPGSLAVLIGGSEPRVVFFVPPRDADAELWAGPRLGPAGVMDRFAPDACHSIEEIEERLPELLALGRGVHYRLGRTDAIDRLVGEALATARARGQRRGSGPRRIVDPGEVLDELRMIKDPQELDRLRTAAAISADGQRAAAAAIRPGVGEWAVQARVDGSFREAGASGPGYPTIVGAGANACVLHYVENSDRIGDDDLVLVDAGAEVALYQGDITRTYPASGRFTSTQRAVYDVVERARAAAIACARPGATIGEVHATATTALAEGLVELGVLSGDVGLLIEQGAHKAFYPHQTSHWLGLDVHDPGDYSADGASRVLEAGMVFTVEPGLYFRPGTGGDRAARYEGIGIRIEDDVAVTDDGCEVFTSGLPTRPDEVEALVRGR